MIVIDACVATKWFLPEPFSDAAEMILAENDIRIAPEHILVEVGNTLLRAYRAEAITLDHAREALSALAQIVQLQATHEIAAAALDIAVRIGCTHYDALYLAAAERWTATFVTADARLVRQLRPAGWTGQVRLIGA